MYDRIVFGMTTLNITQAGNKYNVGNWLTHTGYELDLAGADANAEPYYNWLPNTFFKCVGRWGTRASGNTFFFWTSDKDGTAKKVLCADGVKRVLTLALTHSNKDAIIGKLYGLNEILITEGTQGLASGNHIHLEVCEGCITRKVINSKGYYNLPNMLDARKVFFIYDKKTKVKSTCGLEFKHCAEVEVKDKVTEMLYFVAKKGPVVIRKSLSFENGKSNAAILARIPKGGRARITHFTERHEKDGYEWLQVSYTTATGDVINGFVQGDLQFYLIDWE